MQVGRLIGVQVIVSDATVFFAARWKVRTVPDNQAMCLPQPLRPCPKSIGVLRVSQVHLRSLVRDKDQASVRAKSRWPTDVCAHAGGVTGAQGETFHELA